MLRPAFFNHWLYYRGEAMESELPPPLLLSAHLGASTAPHLLPETCA